MLIQPDKGRAARSRYRHHYAKIEPQCNRQTDPKFRSVSCTHTQRRRHCPGLGSRAAAPAPPTHPPTHPLPTPRTSGTLRCRRSPDNHPPGFSLCLAVHAPLFSSHASRMICLGVCVCVFYLILTEALRVGESGAVFIDVLRRKKRVSLLDGRFRCVCARSLLKCIFFDLIIFKYIFFIIDFIRKKNFYKFV